MIQGDIKSKHNQ